VHSGLVAFALNWLIAAALVYLAARFNLVALVERPAYFSIRGPGRKASLIRVLATGLAGGGAAGLGIGYAVKILSKTLAASPHPHPLWLLGVPAGAAVGVAFALISWGRTPSESAPATTPESALRADRSLVLLFSCPFLLVLPLFWGAAFAPHLLPSHFAAHACYGLGIGITIWLAIALTHTWPQYLLTASWLAACGRLPWRLAAFLSASASPHVGVLCQQGRSYQFRHPMLRDQLAEES
jgi:hypothetical protein